PVTREIWRPLAPGQGGRALELERMRYEDDLRALEHDAARGPSRGGRAGAPRGRSRGSPRSEGRRDPSRQGALCRGRAAARESAGGVREDAFGNRSWLARARSVGDPIGFF